jgi:hypothetical protein
MRCYLGNHSQQLPISNKKKRRCPQGQTPFSVTLLLRSFYWYGCNLCNFDVLNVGFFGYSFANSYHQNAIVILCIDGIYIGLFG